jgi:hypothetical protein
MRMRFLVAALGVHVALALAFATRKPPMPTAAAASSSEVDVDFAVEESAPASPALAAALPAPKSTTTETSTRTATTTATASLGKSSTPTTSEVLTAEPAAAASGAWSAPIFVAGTPATMDTRAPASFFTLPEHGGAAPASTSHGSTTGGLAEGLAEHDASLGLGSGGPVVSAAHAIPVEALVSIDGAGVFDVETDASGHVVSVRVADVTSDDLEWRKVARALQAQLASTTLRVPSGARGVAVRMRVEVIARMPSGAVSGHAIRPFAGANTEAYAGVTGDLSDIGAHPVRTVHARVLGSRPL